jgi:sugar lactone lactonase YvrE
MKKPLSGIIFSSLALLAAIILSTSCNKIPRSDDVTAVPAVVTYSLISSVSQTGALSGGVVTNTNGGSILANGVCWSATNALPTTSDSKTVDTVGTSGYTSTLTGLTGGTTYYLRSYATNSNGTGYGAVIKFTTLTTAGIPTATVTTLAGSTAGTYGYTDGVGTSALFNGPQYISYNTYNGKLYVSDVLNNVIRTIVPATGQVTSYTQSTLGFSNGPLSSASFYGAAGIVFDNQNNTFVADLGNNAIREISAAGAVTTYAGNGLYNYYDATGTSAYFASPQGLAIDASNNIYVADRANNLIRKIAPGGVVTTLAGGVSTSGGSTQQTVPGYADGSTGTASFFNRPTSVALDQKGGLFVVDVNNRALRDVNLSTGATITIAGNSVQKLLLGAPTAVTSDAAGNAYVVDQAGRILEITTQNVLYVLAGSTASGYTDGIGAAAKFNTPSGIAIDANGVLYVTDFGNNVIRKLVVKLQ